MGRDALTATLLTPSRSAAAERHPKIRAAVAALLEAKDELESAGTDFGGHKKAALDAVDAAIDQLRIRIKE